MYIQLLVIIKESCSIEGKIEKYNFLKVNKTIQTMVENTVENTVDGNSLKARIQWHAMLKYVHFQAFLKSQLNFTNFISFCCDCYF